MKKYFCDICGIEIKNNASKLIEEFKECWIFTYAYPKIHLDKFDACNKCLNKKNLKIAIKIDNDWNEEKRKFVIKDILKKRKLKTKRIINDKGCDICGEVIITNTCFGYSGLNSNEEEIICKKCKEFLQGDSIYDYETPTINKKYVNNLKRKNKLKEVKK